MKTLKPAVCLVFAAMLLLGNLSLHAQSDDGTVTITREYTDDEGRKVVETIVKLGEDVDHNIQLDDGDIQIHSFDQLDELKKLKTLKDIDFDFDFDEGDEPSIFRWNTDEDLPEELKGKIKIQREGDTKIFLFDDNEGDASTFIRRGGKEKAFLGIYMGDYTNEDGERITANGQGVVISKIVKGSAAEAAGLKAGDIITRLNGEAVDSHGDISRAIKAQGVGGNLDIAYLRN